MLKPILNQFTTELLRILDFVRKTVGVYPDINNMFLSGGGAKMKGLPELMTKSFELNKTPIILNPFEKIKVPQAVSYLKQQAYPEFAVSVGLALKTQ